MAAFSDKSSAVRKIRLVRAANVSYIHRDLDSAAKFLEDFGIQEAKRVENSIYYRGTGPDAFVYCATKGNNNEFGGAAFVVESIEDLEHASKTLPGRRRYTLLRRHQVAVTVLHSRIQ